jgi:NTP pyrophosphatase (non-canonical NTP hydrolase)
MSVLIPDIPISEYPEPAPRRLHFWERPRKHKDSLNFKIMTEIELSLVRSNIEMGTELSLIQREVGEWAWRNFKEKASGVNPHLGVIEELGELSKAILKKDQGIRGTPEKHDSDAVDAIGDIVIYLLNLLNTMEVDVFSVACDTFLNTTSFAYDEDSSNRKELIILMSKAVAALSSDTRSVGWLLVYLDTMSRSYGYSLLDIVKKTWDIVKKRNWVEDSVVGGGHTH